MQGRRLQADERLRPTSSYTLLVLSFQDQLPERTSTCTFSSTSWSLVFSSILSLSLLASFTRLIDHQIVQATGDALSRSLPPSRRRRREPEKSGASARECVAHVAAFSSRATCLSCSHPFTVDGGSCCFANTAETLFSGRHLDSLPRVLTHSLTPSLPVIHMPILLVLRFPDSLTA